MEFFSYFIRYEDIFVRTKKKQKPRDLQTVTLSVRFITKGGTLKP